MLKGPIILVVWTSITLQACMWATEFNLCYRTFDVSSVYPAGWIYHVWVLICSLPLSHTHSHAHLHTYTPMHLSYSHTLYAWHGILVATCTNPVVKFQSYSTGDITLSTETVFVIEAEVDCKGAEVRRRICTHSWHCRPYSDDSLGCCHVMAMFPSL